MVLRILSRGAIAAVAGATMLAASSVALVRLHARLALAGTARRRRRRSVRLVAWRLARWLAWRLAPRMGLASRLWLGRRLASLGLGRRLGPALWLRSGLPLLVGPVGPPLRRLTRAIAIAPLDSAALALHLLQ